MVAPLSPSSAAAQVAPGQRWDLAQLYASSQAWSQCYQRAKVDVASLDRYSGTLGKSVEAMLTALVAVSDTRRELLRLFSYAALHSDEDLRDAGNLERKQQAQSLLTELAQKTAWLAPEVQSLGQVKARAYLEQSTALKRRFEFFLIETLRRAPHTLGVEAESVLAATGDILAQPHSVFEQLVDAELPYPTLNIEGQDVRIGHAQYDKYRGSDDRAVRKAVFDAFWGAFHGYQGTLGSNLTAQVMGDVFCARARRFSNSLEQALFEDNMPEQVYRTLVAQANAGLPTLHRYLKLRKRMLGIHDELAYFDNYPSLFKLASPPRFSLNDCRRITLEALSPMGEEYLGLLRRGTEAQWSDSHPRTGKNSGAYMNGLAYDVHPYLLLNHNDDYESLSTYAHEWGHAVHTLLANANQPFETAHYSTFVAESASIANEMLLGDHMVSKAGSSEEKLFYLGKQLESIRTTFFRQVLFAEFQLQMHEMRERGEALSGASLTERYGGLLRHYYGEADGVMKIDPLYFNEWAYIPHFYFGYYVWQYATSMAGAAQFTEQIQGQNRVQARERFICLLKAGGSDYAYELYRRAGVDLGQAAPYQALIRRMNRIMEDIESLVLSSQ